MNWNDDWRDELKQDNYEVWERLAECRNNRNDIIIMSKLVVKYNPEKSKQECFDRILEWVTDWNNQINLYPVDDEYSKMLKQI